jgi:rhamnogalacturonyl hydrolase YesR
MGLMHAQRDVVGMINSGTPFDAIEDQIQRIPDLVDDERSALWLYAWSQQGRSWQRNAAAQLLLWCARGS